MALRPLQRLMKHGVLGLRLSFFFCFAASWAYSAAARDTAPIVLAMAGVDVQSLKWVGYGRANYAARSIAMRSRQSAAEVCRQCSARIISTRRAK